VFSIPSDEKLQNIISMIKEKKFSKIPVWENNMENIVGILHVRDLLNLKNLRRKLKSEKNILKKPLFVPDSIMAEDLLRHFHENRDCNKRRYHRGNNRRDCG
jgi:putative hemolysin